MRKCVVCSRLFDKQHTRKLNKWQLFNKTWICLTCYEALNASKLKQLEKKLKEKWEREHATPNLPKGIKKILVDQAPSYYVKQMKENVSGFESAYKSNRNSYIIKLKPDFVACSGGHKFLEHTFETGLVWCAECRSFLFQIPFDKEDISNDEDIARAQAKMQATKPTQQLKLEEELSKPWYQSASLKANDRLPFFMGGTEFTMKKEIEVAPKWLYECLDYSKKLINTYHIDCSEFFTRSTFKLFIQSDKQYAYGYIQQTPPEYWIGIHRALSENTHENYRMAIVVLVHELLHAIHPDWGHDKINPEERKIANKAGYFDALRNMEILYLSGKMHLCE
jgi:hypothetical protein